MACEAKLRAMVFIDSTTFTGLRSVMEVMGRSSLKTEFQAFTEHKSPLH